jgi:hypothetical protein
MDLIASWECETVDHIDISDKLKRRFLKANLSNQSNSSRRSTCLIVQGVVRNILPEFCIKRK